MRRLALAFAFFARAAHADCAKDADAMAALLLPFATEEPTPIFVGATLLEAEGTPIEAAPAVEVVDGKTTLNRLEEKTPAALKDALDTLRKKYALQHGSEPFPGKLAVVIGTDATWSAVVDALFAAQRARYEHVEVVTLVTRTPPISQPPGYAAFLTGLNEFPYAQKSELIDVWLRRMRVICAPLGKVYDDMVDLAPDRKTEAVYLVEHLSAALQDCQCRVDMNRLYAMLFATLAPYDLVHRLTQTTLRLGDAGPTLSFPRAATWADVGPKVLAAARKPGATYRLVAE